MSISNPTSQLVVVNLYTKFEVSILNLERKKKEQIYGRINRRRPIFNSTIQLVVVKLYIKFEVSILYSCGEILDEKCREKEKIDKYREE